MKPSEVLRAARKMIAKPEQWCQEYMYSPLDDGSMCSLGAIHYAAKGDHTSYSVGRAILALVLGGPSVDVAEWNDDPYRTHREVISAFDDAIALAESEGQ
jgi:hypothetical protein